MKLSDLFEHKPLIGMVHLGALPGSARDEGDFSRTLRRATEDARALECGGLDAVMVENFFDAPFYRSAVPAYTVAAMTRAAMAVRESVSIPVGVNVLRNDAAAAIAIAHLCGAQFIRCNVYVGAAVTDQGIIEGAAREAVACRRLLGAKVWIFADVAVKHAAVLGDYQVEQQAQDAVERGLADALIVTGAATGAQTPLERLLAVKSAVPTTPVLAGSGLTERNAAQILSVADGAIVGSSLKREGAIAAPVDVERVRALVRAARGR
jgi:membrane complex biogenesis BtpA family protein